MLNLLNWWNQYEFLLFYFQEIISSTLLIEINTLNPLIASLLLFTGILTSLTPCFLSILPLSFSYINISKSNYINKNIFIFGIFSSLLILLLLSVILDYRYLIYFTKIPFLSFFFLILISLNLLQIIDISSYFSTLKFNKLDCLSSNIIFRTYLNGLLIGFSVIPCSSPIVILINFWLHSATNFFICFLYLFFYILGCFIPFFLVFNFVINYVQIYILGYIWNIIVPLSGCIILSLSIFFFLEKIFI
uniref:Thiol:disulfide interchange protein n=1 Tax=Dasya naccarioides TaxID=2007180 RepID=A0A1Z1MGB4_9FLOR|nr:thiol:disulfide interchange protein [Dasya naccarioides]ARW65107.1 thiol:disulfide interchange protein [Dasya naccarioides]